MLVNPSVVLYVILFLLHLMNHRQTILTPSDYHVVEKYSHKYRHTLESIGLFHFVVVYSPNWLKLNIPNSHHTTVIADANSYGGGSSEVEQLSLEVHLVGTGDIVCVDDWIVYGEGWLIGGVGSC